MVVCILDVLWKSEFFRNLGGEDDKTKTIIFFLKNPQLIETQHRV